MLVDQRGPTLIIEGHEVGLRETLEEQPVAAKDSRRRDASGADTDPGSPTRSHIDHCQRVY